MCPGQRIGKQVLVGPEKPPYVVAVPTKIHMELQLDCLLLSQLSEKWLSVPTAETSRDLLRK